MRCVVAILKRQQVNMCTIKMCTVSFLVLLGATSALSANILFVSIFPSPSHHIWNRALAFGLANKGHNVTMIGPDKDNIHPANYTHLYLEGFYTISKNKSKNFKSVDMTAVQAILGLVNFSEDICKTALKAQGFQQLLNYPPDFKFDVIIMEITAGICFYPLIHRFDYPPTIGVTPFLLPAYLAYNFGNHIYPAYVPWYAVPYTNEMTFMERAWNSLLSYGETLIKNTRQVMLEQEQAKIAFGQDIPNMEKLERHISLLFANYDPILNYPQPLAPNIIPVGGLHTKKSETIPQDLLKILDGAKHGFIVFSLGTNVRSDALGKEAPRALLDAFGKLKELVIWKWESEVENLPKNVIVRKWLPQNDLLGHPNIKLFIGHGGALSTQEAIFHGVPLIVVPFFVDQHVNARYIVDKQLGVFLDYKQISSDYVLQKIGDALDNPTYSSNMKRVSSMFKDRLETPLERAIFWVEYAIRHKDLQFLSSPARDMPFYKASGLDILAFFLSVLVTVILLFYTTIRSLLRPRKINQKLKEN